ncbi:MAG: hypothetical protein R3B13_33610 [Polyangiaceae bacterium]
MRRGGEHVFASGDRHSTADRGCGPSACASGGRGQLKRRLITADGLKVVHDSRRKTLELYDLVRDPRELDNLIDSAPGAHSDLPGPSAFVLAEADAITDDGSPAHHRRFPRQDWLSSS